MQNNVGTLIWNNICLVHILSSVADHDPHFKEKGPDPYFVDTKPHHFAWISLPMISDKVGRKYGSWAYYGYS